MYKLLELALKTYVGAVCIWKFLLDKIKSTEIAKPQLNQNTKTKEPFLGSGTTVKAAIRNERNSIGYEIEEHLLASIKKRINDQTAEMPIEVQFTRRSLEIFFSSRIAKFKLSP